MAGSGYHPSVSLAAAKVIPLRRERADEPSDEVLVGLARGGDVEARELLFRRYARMVNHLAFRLLPFDDEADDLVQDAFIAALTSLQRLKEAAAFPGFLRSIVVRLASKRIRRRRMLVRLGFAKAREVDLDLVVSRDVAPDLAMQLRALYRRIEELEPDVRVAFVLRWVDGATIPEIAKTTGVSEGTVKRRIQRANDALGIGGAP